MINSKMCKSVYLDYNNTKTCPQNIFTVVFCSQGLERTNLNGILKFENSFACLPGKIQLQEHYLWLEKRK